MRILALVVAAAVTGIVTLGACSSSPAGPMGKEGMDGSSPAAADDAKTNCRYTPATAGTEVGRALCGYRADDATAYCDPQHPYHCKGVCSLDTAITTCSEQPDCCVGSCSWYGPTNHLNEVCDGDTGKVKDELGALSYVVPCDLGPPDATEPGPCVTAFDKCFHCVNAISSGDYRGYCADFDGHAMPGAPFDTRGQRHCACGGKVCAETAHGACCTSKALDGERCEGGTECASGICYAAMLAGGEGQDILDSSRCHAQKQPPQPLPEAGLPNCGTRCTPANCLAGRCVATLAINQAYPGPLTVRGSNVYWINLSLFTTGSISTISTNGAGLAVLVQQGFPVALAVDATSLYWLDSHVAGFDTVYMRPLAGGNPVVLASNQDLAMQQLAVTANAVFWVSGPNDGAPSDTIFQVPISGGTPTTVASGLTRPTIAVDAANIYWSNRTSTNTVLMKMPLAGGPSVQLAVGGNMPRMAADGVNLYWVDNGLGLQRVPVGGGATVQMGAAGVPESGVALDSTNVYWGSIFKLAKTATSVTPPTSLYPPPAQGGSKPTQGYLAVDGTSVYWTTGGAINSGVVIKIDKN